MHKKLSLEYVRKEFLKEGYTLLSDVYKNNKQKLRYKCPYDHIHSVCWDAWSHMGRRCAVCSGNAKLTIEKVLKSFEKEGYKLISKKYVNAHTKLKYICPNNHKGSMSWSNWNNKKKFRCPKCSNKISKQEKIISNFLRGLNINIKTNDRNILLNPVTRRNLELDIWLPDMNKAIEFNGNYWHSDPVRKKCDRIKKKLCEELDIDLLVITYEEWVENKEKCKSEIIKFIGDS